MGRSLLVLTPIVLTLTLGATREHGSAQGSLPAVKLQVERASLEAGGFVTIVAEVEVAPDAAAASPRVTIDPIQVANPSDASGRARLHFHANYSYADDVIKVVEVPARRVVRIPTADGPFFGGSWLVVTSEATGAAAPPLVVERVSYVEVDGIRRARQATIFGNLQ
jgi:hypothetical protein